MRGYASMTTPECVNASYNLRSMIYILLSKARDCASYMLKRWPVLMSFQVGCAALIARWSCTTIASPTH
jgi:hypothetical protein